MDDIAAAGEHFVEFPGNEFLGVGRYPVPFRVNVSAGATLHP